jgi:hypothetical protein
MYVNIATKAAIYTVHIYIAQTLCERYGEFRNMSILFADIEISLNFTSLALKIFNLKK